jgi:hypothetical protein
MQDFYLISYYISEVFHSLFLVVFIYTLYQILSKKYTPYSNIYAGIYFGTHAVYNGCPISTLQNLLSQRAGLETIDNLFLRAELGVWNLPLRILSLILVVGLFYNSYMTFKKLEIKPKYWLHYWLESKLNRAEFSENMIFDVEKEVFVEKELA